MLSFWASAFGDAGMAMRQAGAVLLVNTVETSTYVCIHPICMIMMYISNTDTCACAYVHIYIYMYIHMYTYIHTDILNNILLKQV